MIKNDVVLAAGLAENCSNQYIYFEYIAVTIKKWCKINAPPNL
jgi:hypothetical protein